MAGQHHSYYQPVQPTLVRDPTKVLFRAFIVLIIFMVASVTVLATFHTSQLLTLVESADVVPTQIVSPLSQPPRIDPEDKAIADIANIIKAHSNYTIGVAIEDISTGTLKQAGSTDHFTAASTGKLITAADYYHGVETGEYSLSMPLGAYNAQFQIKEMINDSDNDSWTLLNNYMGHPQLSQYASSVGINGYSVGGNELTTADLAGLLTKLYTGKLLDSEHTKQLLSYMQHTNWETLIPAALPNDVTAYHKYGLIDGNLHDASIIVHNGKAYAFVVMTYSTAGYSDDNDRTNLIHTITKTAVDDLFA